VWEWGKYVDGFEWSSDLGKVWLGQKGVVPLYIWIVVVSVYFHCETLVFRRPICVQLLFPC
jgi:hypothetical protein